MIQSDSAPEHRRELAPIINSWDEAFSQSEKLLKTSISETQRKAIQAFYIKLAEQNKVMNLTRLIELQDFLTFHLLDTVSLQVFAGDVLSASSLNSDKINYLDLGSGCGVPGIILHILLNEKFDLKTHLCDSIAKKCSFLQAVSGELTEQKLIKEEIKILNCRSESLKQEKRFFNLITARAFAKPIVALEDALGLLANEGTYLAQSSCSFLDSTDSLMEQSQKLLKKQKTTLVKEEAFSLGGKKRFVTLFQRKN